MQTETSSEVDTTTAQPAQDEQSQTAAPVAEEKAAQPAESEASASGEGNEKSEQQEQQPKSEEEDQAARDESGRFKSKIQKRIDELTHARHAAEREAARWRSIAESQQAAPAPQAHEYATDEDYEAARRQHEIKEAAREIAAGQAAAAAQQYQKDAESTIDAAYAERVKEATSRIPDFVDVVGKADIQITHDMLHALKSSANGPELVYELAKNTEEAKRIASLPPAQMFMALGAMEAKLSSGTQSAAKPAARTTSAPPPVKPGSPAAAPANTDPSTMSQEQYEAWRKAQGSRYIR